MRKTLAGAFAGSILIVGSLAALAADANRSTPISETRLRNRVPETAALRQTLINVSLDSDAAVKTLPSGFTPVGVARAIQCTYAAGCTLAISAMAQVAGAPQNWSVCATVDGSYVNPVPVCPYQNPLTTGNNALGQVVQYEHISKGSHKVQIEVEFDTGGSLLEWSAEYRLSATPAG